MMPDSIGEGGFENSLTISGKTWGRRRCRSFWLRKSESERQVKLFIFHFDIDLGFEIQPFSAQMYLDSW